MHTRKQVAVNNVVGAAVDDSLFVALVCIRFVGSDKR